MVAIKPFYSFISVVALVLAACGGGTSPTAAPGGPTAAPGQPTAAPGLPTTPPAQGGTTVTVTLTGGPDAGTYTGSANPNCSVGIVGPGGWGTQYSVPDGPDNQLSSLQLISAAPGMADDPDAFFRGIEFQVTVTIGTLFAETARDYEVTVQTEDSGEDSSGSGSAQISDAGATAVIVATGTTADGVGISATVNCPSVTRN